MTAARLIWYALFLSGFRCSTVYRRTTVHGNADGLSCLPLEILSARNDNDTDIEAFHVLKLDLLPVTADQVLQAKWQDPAMAAIFNPVQSNDFSDGLSLQSFVFQRNELTTHHGCMMCGARVIVPPKL